MSAKERWQVALQHYTTLLLQGKGICCAYKHWAMVSGMSMAVGDSSAIVEVTGVAQQCNARLGLGCDDRICWTCQMSCFPKVRIWIYFNSESNHYGDLFDDELVEVP